MNFSRITLSLAAAGSLCAALPATAQDVFPNKPIRMVLPTGAGSGSDIMGRQIAAIVSQSIGQNLLPDNRPGGSGAVGLNIVRNAPADGYTIAFTNVSQVVHAPLLMSPPPFEPVRDFEAVQITYNVLLMLNAHVSQPYKTLRELVDYARANPNKISYASAGTGTISHLWMEFLKKRQGLQMTHIPYKGSGPAWQSLVAGETHLNAAETVTMGGPAGHANTRVLVLLSDRASARLPNVQTVRDAGFAEMRTDFWLGFLTTKGTPAPIVRKLNEEINKAMATPKMRELVEKAGGELLVNDPAGAAAILANDYKTWVPIVKELGVKAE